MEIKLMSAPMVHTPSIIELVMQLAGERKMNVADKILESYGLNKTVRLGVLHGSIPWRVEGETVILTILTTSSGWTGTQNARGRCEDAPCCGCCTF